MNDLLRTGHYTGGEWHRGGATYAVRDPASGEVVADVARGGTYEAALAIEAAHRALPA